jgi:hypothetical protein
MMNAVDSGAGALKLGVVFFWGAWFATVFLTNAFSALKAAGVVGEKWKFASTNYAAVVKAVSIYGAPAWVPRLLFAGVLAWQLTAAVLFAWTFASSLAAQSLNTNAADLAFGTGIALWAAFMIADEITMKYAYEQSHELLFIAQLACLIAIHLPPW